MRAYLTVWRLPSAPVLLLSGFAGRLPSAMVPLALLLMVQQQTGSYAVAGLASATLGIAIGRRWRPCSAGSPTAAARARCCSPQAALYPVLLAAAGRRRPRRCAGRGRRRRLRRRRREPPRWCPAPCARCGRGSTRGCAPPPTPWTPPPPSWSSSSARRWSPSSPCWPARRSPSALAGVLAVAGALGIATVRARLRAWVPVAGAPRRAVRHRARARHAARAAQRLRADARLRRARGGHPGVRRPRSGAPGLSGVLLGALGAGLGRRRPLVRRPRDQHLAAAPVPLGPARRDHRPGAAGLGVQPVGARRAALPGRDGDRARRSPCRARWSARSRRRTRPPRRSPGCRRSTVGASAIGAAVGGALIEGPLGVSGSLALAALGAAGRRRVTLVPGRRPGPVAGARCRRRSRRRRARRRGLTRACVPARVAERGPGPLVVFVLGGYEVTRTPGGFA